MNIECSSCHAKYAVADERVAGRKVRIRCKRCHEPMIVDGRSVSLDGATTGKYPTASAQTLLGLKADPSSDEERLPTPVPRRKRVGKKADRAGTDSQRADSTDSAVVGELAATPSSPGESQDDRAPDEGWFVALAQDEQPTMGLAEIVKAYQTGSIDEDTYFWREGMSDWTALEEIPDLLAAIKTAHPKSEASPISVPVPAAISSVSKRAAASARSQLRPVSATPASDWFAHSSRPAKSQRGNGGYPSSREASRALVHSDRQSEPSAPQSAPSSGQTESSVMFSLGALVGTPQAKPAPQSSGRRDDMLLFDLPPPSLAPPLPFDGSQIEELARRASEQAELRSASTLAPAMQAASAQPPPPLRGGRSVPLVTAMFGMIAAVSVTWALTRTPLESRSEPAASGAATRTATASTEATTPVPGKDSEAQGQAISELRPAGDGKIEASGDKKSEARGTASKSSATDPDRRRSTASDRSTKATSTGSEAKQPGGSDTESPAASEVQLGAFSTSAAKQALESAAATSSSACKKPDGPTGEGRVEVTFMPSGRASKAVVGGAFAGTTVGGCIAKVFRRVLVPGFSGDPVTVSKKVVIK